jgi:hypothetical protein
MIRLHCKELQRRGKEVENGDGRRGREDYEDLDRLLEEADHSLGDGDLRGTNEALKRAGVKAASMWGEVGKPMLPGHTRRLVALIGEVQQDLGNSERNHPDRLRKDLRELRSRFELEARRDSGNTTIEQRESGDGWQELGRRDGHYG